jgi:hypothetical protein
MTGPGTQSDKAVESITVSPVDAVVWSKTEAKTICMTYMPSDAQHVNDIPVSSSSAEDMVYRSTLLASQFTADNFTDASSNQVKAGTFDIQYMYKPDGSVNDCNIQIGEQQTQ